VYAGQYEGWYDAGQEEYVTDSKAQEYQFKSPINGKPLVRKTEKNYFFKLKAYREALQQHFAANPAFVQPDARRNEILNRIAEAEDVPISRTGSMGWGIPVPGDPEQTIWVWFDALFNYLTYVDTPERKCYWQAGATHVIAKDILWFHAAIWPALLLALRKCPGYEGLALPRQVYAHSFWISEGQKMSKSLGNFIDLEKLDHYAAAFGLDALRYFLVTSGPLGTTDSDFSEAKFIEVYNNDLANTLGNCFARISNMTNRYFGGKLPAPAAHVEASAEHAHEAELARKRYVAAMDKLDLAGGAAAGLDLVRAIDSYIEQTQPFKLAKDPAKLPEVGAILYHCAEAMRIATLLLWPVIPGKAQEMWRRLGCESYAAALDGKAAGNLTAWAKWGELKPGTTILQGEPLFPRYQAKDAEGK
jgi:methionyl-tRNA synthetase